MKTISLLICVCFILNPVFASTLKAPPRTPHTLGEPLLISCNFLDMKNPKKFYNVVVSSLLTGDQEVVKIKPIKSKDGSSKNLYKTKIITTGGIPKSNDNILQTKVGDTISIKWKAGEEPEYYRKRTDSIKVVSGKTEKNA
jgi:hypothetical protein